MLRAWLLVPLLTGCAEILGIEPGEPRPATTGAGGTAAAGGAGGQGGSTGGAPAGPLSVTWAERFGGVADEHVVGVSVDQGEIALAGNHYGQFTIRATAIPHAGNSDIFAVKLSQTREVEWAHGFGDPEQQYALAIVQRAIESQTYITARFEGTLDLVTDTPPIEAADGNGLEGLVLRIGDSDGQNSAFEFEGLAEQYPGPIASVPIAQQNLLITGSTYGDMGIASGTVFAPTTPRGFLARIYGGGDPDWVVPFGTTGEQEGLGIATDGSLHVAVVGTWRDAIDIAGEGVTGGGDGNGFVALLTMGQAIGDTQWLRIFAQPGEESAHLVAIAGDGDVLVAGTFSSLVTIGSATYTVVDDGPDVFLARYFSDGTVRWSTTFPVDGVTFRGMVVDDALGRIYVAGELDGSLTLGSIELTSDGSDIFVAMLDGADGTVLDARVLGDLTGGGSTLKVVGMGMTPDGTLILAGDLEGTADMGGTLLTSAGGSDFFVVEIAP